MTQKKIIQSLLLFLVPYLLLAQIPDTFRLFYLGGQSNMDGYGYVQELPDHLNRTLADIWIFHGNTAADGATDGGLGMWQKLKPGHGAGFSSDGVTNNYSKRFGPELSFAKHIQELLPGENIAIIKYSRGGTSIDSLASGYAGGWEADFRSKNGINQYDHFLTTLNNAFATSDINKDGKKDILLPSGIVWMQGESDAVVDEALAARYYFNLKRLMDLMRAALRTDDLPVVIGKISDSWNNDSGKIWKYGDLVQHAQEKYVSRDQKAAIVRSTRYYEYSDPWHYDSAGYIDLGKKMAEAIIILLEE